MELKRKDAQILYLMTEYCHDVLLALRMFSCDENIFFSNRVFRHACAMPIMQIGELARRLSDDFYCIKQRYRLEGNQGNEKSLCA